VLDLQTGAARSLGPGCDPAFSPDGRRIAYAAPPTQSEPEMSKGPTAVNSIRLVNRLGQNGWDFAKAAGVDAPAPHTGRVLYAPAWSPDGAQIVYHRFLGYQALVDINLSEIAGSFEGGGQVVGEGAGWLLPARFASDGKTLAISDHHFGDPRGFGGYDNWYVSVIRLEGTREIAMPSGTVVALGQQVDRLSRGQSVAWAPDGKRLAVELPPGWRPDLPNDEPIDAGERPGELWLWTPGQNPSQKLLEGVDFASPLAWLP
jgi:Tol biopolymer transport system component